MENINLTKRTDIYNIDPRNVVIMDNFNVRRDFDLDELKEQIKAKGVLNPISVIKFKADDGTEKYKLVDGERRLRATLAAIAEGADIPRIKALFIPKDESQEELMIQQMMRNEGKRFSEIECGIMFKRFRDEYGYSQNVIAEKFRKSAAFVCKCLKLVDLPEDIQQRIINNQISAHAARDIAKDITDRDAQIEAVETAVQSAQAGKKVTNKEINAIQKEVKEAKKIIQALRSIEAFMGAGDFINVRKLEVALELTGSLENAMKQLKINK
jgi:ParB family chromosome partitioning protein